MLYSGNLPDLIVLDLMTPVMNGWQFRDRQLADARLAEIPVIILTAAEGTDASVIDATDFVRKPVQIEEFVECIRRYTVPEDAFDEAPPTVRDGVVAALVDLEDSSPHH
jgi:CheY-like chemotaxis protein